MGKTNVAEIALFIGIRGRIPSKEMTYSVSGNFASFKLTHYRHFFGLTATV